MKADRKSLLNQSMSKVAAIPEQKPNRFDLAERLTGEGPAGEGVQQAAAGGVMKLDIALIDENPYNARRIYRPETVAARAASIAKEGQLDPVKVISNPDKPGRFILVDGHYRFRALKSLSKKTINAIELEAEGTPQELYRISWAQNHERSGQTALDNAIAWRAMLQDGTFSTEEQIAEATGLSRGWVNKTLSVGTLPADVIERIAESPVEITVSSGYELAQFYRDTGDEKATMDLLDLIIQENPGKRALEQYRKERTKSEIKPRQRSRQYKMPTGSLKEWDNGRVLLDLVIDNPEERQAVIELLQERFGKTQAEG